MYFTSCAVTQADGCRRRGSTKNQPPYESAKNRPPYKSAVPIANQVSKLYCFSLCWNSQPPFFSLQTASSSALYSESSTRVGIPGAPCYIFLNSIPFVAKITNLLHLPFCLVANITNSIVLNHTWPESSNTRQFTTNDGWCVDRKWFFIALMSHNWPLWSAMYEPPTCIYLPSKPPCGLLTYSNQLHPSRHAYDSYPLT